MIAPRSYPVPALLLGASTPGFLARLQAVRARVLTHRLPGLPTGVRALDEHLGGLQQGVHLLSAAAGVGKTTLALQIARSVASDGASVVYLAFDEDGDRLALKLTAGYGGLVAADYLEGKADPDDLIKAEEVHRAALSRIRIFNGSAGIHGDVAGEMLNEAKAINGTEDGLLVVDFLQTWAARMSDIGDFRLAVTHLLGQLREVAINYRVPVLAIVAQGTPRDGDGSTRLLRESSDPEYAADSICLLTEEPHTESSRLRRQVTLTCLKNRWGVSFSQRLIFDAERGLFAEERSQLLGGADVRPHAQAEELAVAFDDGRGAAQRQHEPLTRQSPPLWPAASHGSDLAAA